MGMHQQAARAAPPDLLSTDNPEVLRQYLNGAQTRHKGALPQRQSHCANFHYSERVVRSAERKTDQCNVRRQCSACRTPSGKGNMTKETPKRSQPRQRIWSRQSADCNIHRAYLCRLDRPRLGSIMKLIPSDIQHRTSVNGVP